MNKNFKIIISLILFSLFFIFSQSSVLADSCDELKPILDKFYQASQEENIDAYMALMDQNYLRENLLDNYEDYVKSAWEVYDTKDYKLDIYNCKTEEENALAYFNLATTLVSEGQEIPTQRNYVASFHKLDTWKIKYVMDEDVFAQFQNSLYSQLFLDATKEQVDKVASDAEQVLAYNQLVASLTAEKLPDTVSDGVPAKSQKNTTKNNKKNWWGFLVILLGLGAFGAYWYKNKKKSE